jgi:hypothetical protein
MEVPFPEQELKLTVPIPSIDASDHVQLLVQDRFAIEASRTNCTFTFTGGGDVSELAKGAFDCVRDCVR